MLISRIYTDLAYRTKDELQALEADLKLLALSNKDLSHSNKTLSDTIAAISRPLLSPAMPQAQDPHVDLSAVPVQKATRDMHATLLMAMPPNTLPPITPRQLVPSGDMSDHLQRCMKSVQDLAMTISCALDALQGREKTGSSDIHGSYASLKATMDQLPATVQCDHYKQSVAWSHLEPIGYGVGPSGPCNCVGQTVPPLAEPCSAPMSRNRLRAKSDRAVGPRPSSREVSSVQSQSAGKDKSAFQHDYSMMTEFDALLHEALQQMHEEQQGQTSQLLPAQQRQAQQQIQQPQQVQKAQTHPNVQQLQRQAQRQAQLSQAPQQAQQTPQSQQLQMNDTANCFAHQMSCDYRREDGGSTQRPTISPLAFEKTGTQGHDSRLSPTPSPDSSTIGDAGRDPPLSLSSLQACASTSSRQDVYIGSENKPIPYASPGRLPPSYEMLPGSGIRYRRTARDDKSVKVSSHQNCRG